MTNIPHGDIDRERRLREQRRRNRANPWRCLLPLQYAAYAILIVLALEFLDSVLCSKLPSEDSRCMAGNVPQWLYFVREAVIVGAIFACVYRWWRQHYRRGGH